jgi:hypothetical protein
MANSWETPPAISPGIGADIKAMAAVFSANVNSIPLAMHQKALAAAGVTSPKISLPTLIDMINKILVPTVQEHEGGWGDHPNDSGGPTMRGVILTTFVSNFDAIFTNTSVQAVNTAANNFNKKYPTWKTDKTLGKQVLFLVNTDHKVAGLFYHLFCASAYSRYPIAIMSEDPYLGFLLAEGVWGSGAGLFTNARLNDMAKKFGWNGKDSSWASHIASLGDRTTEMAMEVIRYRYDHLIRISKPGTKNSVFRNGWLNRLVNFPNSNLMHVVILTENFLLNKKGMFKFSPAELTHMKRKADIYMTTKIELPG